MASDLFPIRRSTRPSPAKTGSGNDILRGNPLADAVVRAFRQTFGLPGVEAANDAPDAAKPTTDGTIVPPPGEINP